MSTNKNDTSQKNTLMATVDTNGQHQRSDSDQELVTQQQYPSQNSDDIVNEADTSTVSVRPVEASTARETRLDFIRSLPVELLYDIFKVMTFFDFATCVQVCTAWQTILMNSVWPQIQSKLIIQYPSMRDVWRRAYITEWMTQVNRHIHDLQERRSGTPMLRLQYQLKAHRGVVLGGNSNVVLDKIKEKSSTLKALVIDSIISPELYGGLLLCLANCHELNELTFKAFLHASTRNYSFGRHLSVTSLSINGLCPFSGTTHMDILKEILLICPSLQELFLSPRSYYRGCMLQILRMCPSSLLTFAFTRSMGSLTSLYKPVSSVRSVREFITVIDQHLVDLFDLGDTIKSIAGSLQVLCLTILSSHTFVDVQCSAMSNLSKIFCRCDNLHTIDIYWGNEYVMSDTLCALSSLSMLETVFFTLAPVLQGYSYTARTGLMEFFTQTHAPLKRVGLHGFSKIIDEKIISSLLDFSGLKFLQITGLALLEQLHDKYSDVQQIQTKNPKLQLIETDSPPGIQLLPYTITSQ